MIIGAVKAALPPVEPASTGLCDIVIDVTSKWHRTDLAKVLELAAPGAIIKVHRGLYDAQPVIDKPVEIVGEEEAGPIRLTGRAGQVVISHETKVRIAKIAIRQDDTGHGAIIIERGQLVIEACEISSNININEIIGVNAGPIIRHNKIKNCKGSGISIPCSGCRIIKDNEILWHKYPCIVIKNDADPLGCRNQTPNGRSNVIPIFENGRGTIDDNDILGHGEVCILMTTTTYLVVCRNRIHNGSNTGVFMQ